MLFHYSYDMLVKTVLLKGKNNNGREVFMMKKILSAVLSVTMAFCMLAVFAGCDKKAGKLICGVTIFEPMNYQEANGEWTGFDTEFARLVGEKLDMKVEFQKIDWKQKYTELEAGTINCIWNGFTANGEDDGKPRNELVDFSYSYMNNKQCVVIKKDNADQFTKVEDLADKKIAAENGSAGEAAAKDVLASEDTYIGAESQVSTLIEVKSGAVQCAVIDILLAQTLVGNGDYSDLAIADIELAAEVYAVGFKKGSDLTEKVNKAIQELFDEGEMDKLAAKYNLENYLQLNKGKIG